MTKPRLFRLFAVAFGIAAGGLDPKPACAEGRRPNVLLIVPDQWRGQDLGCMGNSDVRTPNLDRLASQGILFRNTFANTPVCCPARADLLTGTYAHKNGMMANDLRLRESETTIAEILTRTATAPALSASGISTAASDCPASFRPDLVGRGSPSGPRASAITATFAPPTSETTTGPSSRTVSSPRSGPIGRSNS